MDPDAQRTYDESPDLRDLLTWAANSPTVGPREVLPDNPNQRPAGEPGGPNKNE